MADDMKIDELAAELYRMEIQKRSIETRMDEVRADLLTQMNIHHADRRDYPEFTVIRAKFMRYGMPKPDVVRQLFGTLANKYIKEVVDPRFRLAIPPADAEKLCPVTKETPYVQLRLAGDKDAREE